MMFKKISPPLLALIAAIVITACDIIEEPYMSNPGGNGSNGEVARKVLLEEFTGHQCPNCPEGSSTAEALKELFGDQLIIISIHAGFFARTTAPDFLADYRTAAGNEISAYFGVAYNPVGMVNRKEFIGSLLLNPSAWGGAISEILEEEPQADINLNLNFQPSTRHLEVTIESTLLESLQCPVYLAAFLVEDSLVSPQKTNDSQYPDGIIPDYVHRHVLRSCINGTWGEALSSGEMMEPGVYTKTYSLTLNEEWNANNCSVVAYIYSGQNFEVIQAEEEELD